MKEPTNMTSTTTAKSAPLANVSRAAVRGWMTAAKQKYIDDCGEVDATSLATDAAEHFGCDYLPSDHWCWDIAAEVASA